MMKNIFLEEKSEMNIKSTFINGVQSSLIGIVQMNEKYFPA